MCKVLIPNFEISPRKYAMKKCIFSASIYIGKSHSLIHIFHNYRRTKCQTFVYKQKVLSCFFWSKVIVKNNDFATQKWRIWRPGRMAWERLIDCAWGKQYVLLKTKSQRNDILKRTTYENTLNILFLKLMILNLIWNTTMSILSKGRVFTCSLGPV